MNNLALKNILQLFAVAHFEVRIIRYESTPFEIVEKLAACGGDLVASHYLQYIRSPGYNSHDYPNRTNCKWTLRAAYENETIVLQFTNFSTEACCDYLTIHDNLGFNTR